MPAHENARGGAKHIDLPIHPVVARAVSLCPSLPPLSRQLSWASFLDGLVGIREASTIEIFTPCPWMLAEVRIAVRIVVALLLPCGCRCRRRPVDLPRDPSATRRVAHPAIADGGGARYSCAFFAVAVCCSGPPPFPPGCCVLLPSRVRLPLPPILPEETVPFTWHSAPVEMWSEFKHSYEIMAWWDLTCADEVLPVQAPTSAPPSPPPSPPSPPLPPYPVLPCSSAIPPSSSLCLPLTTPPDHYHRQQ